MGQIRFSQIIGHSGKQEDRKDEHGISDCYHTRFCRGNSQYLYQRNGSGRIERGVDCFNDFHQQSSDDLGGGGILQNGS